MATNLQFIKSQSGTDVSTLSVTDCFNADYDVYAIYLTKIDTTQDNSSRIRLLDSGGSVISASEYDTANLRLRANAGFEELRYTGQTYFQYMISIRQQNYDGAGLMMYVFNPYDSGSYTFIQYQETSYSTNYLGYKSIGVHKSAETITGFQILNTAGDYQSVGFSVYGVK